MATRSWKISRFLMAASLLAVLLAGLSLTTSNKVEALNPITMSFQGKVVNANGTNVTDGTYSFVFKMYTVSSGGSALWTETQSSVTVTAGVFQVNLGSSCPFFTANACNNSTPIDFNANPNLYLGITFNSDPAGEMTPRVQLQSVPFAYNADKVGGLSVSQLVQLSPAIQQVGFINVSGASTIGGGLSVTGATNVTGGNLMVQQTATGAALILDRTDGMIASLKTGSAKAAFLYDSAGNFSIGRDTRTNIAAGNTAGTDTLTALANGNVGIGDVDPVATFVVGAGDLFQVAGATGTITTAGGYIQSGSVANLLTGATSFTAAGTALSVTNAASVGSLVVTTAGASITGGINNNSGGITNAGVISGVTSVTGTGALAVAAGGTAQNLTLNASTTGQVQIGGTSTGDILLGGGSASTGCTVTNASGNFACTATITTATFNATTAIQANGIAGTTVAACAAGQYIGNGVKVDDGLITAGTCRNDATGLSDVRLKQNITTLDSVSALNALNQLRPVSYEFNELYHQVTGDPLEYGLQYGFIAQEVQQVMPGLVNTDINGQDGYYGIDYHAFYGLLTAAVQELSIKVDNLAAGTVSSSGSVVTSALLSNGALEINSGTSGDVTIDSGGNSAAVNIGVDKASQVNIASAGKATNIKGALVTEGPAEFKGDVTMSFSSPSASFQINKTGSAANFKVAGNGDLVTSGSLTTKGGSFQLLDTADNQLISFDQAGSANFKGNLNLASASLTGGLSVGGDVNVAGLSTFQKMATFLAKTVFRQDVEFSGHITVAKDSAGYASLRIGESQVHVPFTTAYTTPPIVTANFTDGQFGLTSISNITTEGFDIHLHDPATVDTMLSWTALGVQEPLTASNPLTLNP